MATRTRDTYQGWVWFGLERLEDVFFGYIYQDPTAGPSIRMVVENAWGLSPEQLAEQASQANYMGSGIFRLGPMGFQSFGEVTSPADMYEMLSNFFAGSFGAPGGKLLFLPRSMYETYGLPAEPDWLQYYR